MFRCSRRLDDGCLIGIAFVLEVELAVKSLGKLKNCILLELRVFPASSEFVPGAKLRRAYFVSLMMFILSLRGAAKAGPVKRPQL